MNETAASSGDLLINGALLPGLWSHARQPDEPRICPVERHTFAADRWRVRYAAPEGGAVTQVRSAAVPAESLVICSVELRPIAEVTQTVFFGQTIEAAEAPRYRQRLVFSAWVFVEGSGDATVELHASSPDATDLFTDRADFTVSVKCAVPRGRWARLELSLDGGGFGPTGLLVELAFVPALLEGVVRVADLRLTAPGAPIAPRPAALESLLAERFFQRHDSSRINSLGRALVVNAHELHFQFTFPEMRAFPACTLPHSEEGLRVFHLEGIPQSGFRYDVTYRSRSSVIIRATKENHGLTDGFLSFVGDSAAILLDAEL